MRKQIIIIDEENHGTIGAATSYAAAKRYIIEEGWLTDMDDVYHDHKLVNVKELFGENWKERVIEQDNDWFDGMFYFREVDLAE